MLTLSSVSYADWLEGVLTCLNVLVYYIKPPFSFNMLNSYTIEYKISITADH